MRAAADTAMGRWLAHLEKLAQLDAVVMAEFGSIYSAMEAGRLDGAAGMAALKQSHDRHQAAIKAQWAAYETAAKAGA